MNFHARFLSLASLLLAACSTTTVVKRGEPFALDGSATVVTSDSGAFAVRSARLEVETLKVVPKGSTDTAAIPLSRVKQVESSNAGHGALVGLLVGAGAGAFLGNAIAGGGGEGQGEDRNPYADEAAGAGTVIGVVLGGVAGLALGVAGSKRTYVFEVLSAEPDSVSDSGIRPWAERQSDASP